MLGECGWEVVSFDASPYLYPSNRVLRALQHRLLEGPHVWRLNRDLVDFIKHTAPLDVIWIDKGRWVCEETLRRVKLLTGAFLVHYTPDPAFTLHTSRHFNRAIPIYDLCITNKRYEVKTYSENGEKQVLFALQGIDDRFVNCARCALISDVTCSGVVFIGHSESYYVDLLSKVGRKHEDLKIWGMGWERSSQKRIELRPFVKGGPLWGEDYVVGLAGARIGLGLLSKYCHDQFTTRTFEIPAAGTMLIAERTEEHQELFTEGKEAEFFSSVDELNDKIDYYKINESVRTKIAEGGRKRVLGSYHWKQVLSPVIRSIEVWR